MEIKIYDGGVPYSFDLLYRGRVKMKMATLKLHVLIEHQQIKIPFFLKNSSIEYSI